MEKIKWNDMEEEQVAPEMQRKMIYGDQVMVTRMKFKDGFIVPWHSHHNEQVSEVFKGTIRFWFDDDESQHIDLHAGESIVIKGHRTHKALIIGDVETMDIFSPPRQDWIDGTDDYLRK